MEFYMLSGFVGILREIHKIFTKNGKLMISLSLLYLSLISLSYLSAVFSTRPLHSDWIIRATFAAVTVPKPPQFYSLSYVKDDIRNFVAIQWIYIITITILTMYFVAATIIASALTHGGKNLSFKQLLLSTIKSLKMPFLIVFYITYFGFLYDFFYMVNLFPIILIIQQSVTEKASAIVLGILATIIYSSFYFAGSWIMQALVISVLEEKGVFQAFRSAGQIVKGKQLQGFLLNLLFVISGLIILLGMRLMTIKQSSGLTIVIGLVLVNFSCVLKILWWMANTVFYYKCKKLHGEEVEFRRSIVYSIIPTTPLINESLP